MKPTNLETIRGRKGANPIVDALNEARDNLAFYIEYTAIMAKQKKAYYDALVSEGFTEDQALVIVKEVGQ